MKDDARLDYSVQYRFFHDDVDESERARTVKYTGDYLRPHLPKSTDARILDIGCGWGFALTALREMGYREIHGVDMDSEQIAVASRFGLSVECVSNTPEYLDAHQGEFDAIIMLDVLEHIHPAEQILILRAIFRALKPDGSIILRVPNASALLASRWLYNDLTHCFSYTEHSLRFLLINAGFSGIEISGGANPRRPSPRLWRRSVRQRFWKDLIRFLWFKVLETEMGDWENVRVIPLDLNMTAVAQKTAIPSSQP